MEEKTDQEIYQAALAEWYGVLGSMWTLIGKKIEPDRLKIYGRNLSPIPLGLLEKAIDRVFRENIYSSIPVPGVIWEAVRKELGDPHDLMLAVEQWQPNPIGYYFTKDGLVAL